MRCFQDRSFRDIWLTDVWDIGTFVEGVLGRFTLRHTMCWYFQTWKMINNKIVFFLNFFYNFVLKIKDQPSEIFSNSQAIWTTVNLTELRVRVTGSTEKTTTCPLFYLIFSCPSWALCLPSPSHPLLSIMNAEL